MAAARETLEARARILRAVRGWFEAQGFLEVETPARVRSPGQEVHLDAVAGRASGALADHLARVPHEAAGRGGPAAHRPDRQVLARRRVGPAPPAASSRWSSGTARARRSRRWPTTARRCCARPRAAAGRDPAALGLARAVRAHDRARAVRAPRGHRARRRRGRAAALRAKARGGRRRGGHARPPGTTSSIRCSSTASSRALAAAGPTFVFDWPAPLGALARPKPGDPRVVERFELYAGGLELANAFGELTDPVEQRRRFEDEARIRAARGKAGLPDRRGAAGGAAADAADRRDRLGLRPSGHARAGRAATSGRWSHSGTNATDDPITLARFPPSCYALRGWRPS